MPEAFNFLKNRIAERLPDPDLEAEVRRHYAHWIVWAILGVLRGDSTIEISLEEAKSALSKASEDTLQSVAWGLWKMLADTEAEDVNQVWTNEVEPFFKFVWPRDQAYQTDKTSRRLIRLVTVAGENMVQAVELIRPLIQPFAPRSVNLAFGLEKEKNESVIAPETADSILEMFFISIDRSKEAPDDLAKFLKEIVDVDASLNNDHRYLILWPFCQNRYPSI